MNKNQDMDGKIIKKERRGRKPLDVPNEYIRVTVSVERSKVEAYGLDELANRFKDILKEDIKTL